MKKILKQTDINVAENKYEKFFHCTLFVIHATQIKLSNFEVTLEKLF